MRLRRAARYLFHCTLYNTVFYGSDPQGPELPRFTGLGYPPATGGTRYIARSKLLPYSLQVGVYPKLTDMLHGNPVDTRRSFAFIGSNRSPGTAQVAAINNPIPQLTVLVTCTSRSEAQAALDAAKRILEKVGVTLHAEKTRIVHVRQGFEFLGFKIKRGKPSSLKLAPDKIPSGVVPGSLYAYPREKSVEHFKEQIRKLTRRKAPVKTQQLIDNINPIIRGWGNYYCKAHVRLLFYRLNTWIVRRIWSHKCKRWRNMGWKKLPHTRLYGEMGLVNLIALIPSLASARKG